MLSGISVILVRPRFPENIGMAARAMANTGVSELILVQPERWDKDKAAPLATAQGMPVLDACRLADTLEEALRPFVVAFGTTARTGGWRRDILSPESAALQVRHIVRGEGHTSEGTGTGESGRVALVFGSEDRGLMNAEIELCARLVNIPTAIGSSSFNLAQAVLIFLYECMKADMALPFVPGQEQRRLWAKPARSADSRRATLEEEALLMHTLEATLLAVGHLPEDNPGWFMQPMRRFLRKSSLRRHEFDMIMGVCRRILKIIPIKNKGF